MEWFVAIWEWAASSVGETWAVIIGIPASILTIYSVVWGVRRVVGRTVKADRGSIAVGNNFNVGGNVTVDPTPDDSDK
ncbi:MAG: hypothetical protein MI749_07555 [Desulfovibrionales bacterium]|nr:hypothetical protein [Desulfovibrionales bacterium]